MCTCVCECITVPVNVCKDNRGLHPFNGRNFSAAPCRSPVYKVFIIHRAWSIFCSSHYSWAIFSEAVDEAVKVLYYKTFFSLYNINFNLCCIVKYGKMYLNKSVSLILHHFKWSQYCWPARVYYRVVER